jgi:hypothetical protein
MKTCTGQTYSSAGAAACSPWITCGVGQYRSGSSSTSAGTCLPWVTCSSGQYRTGSSSTSLGSCTACPQGQTSGPGATYCYQIGSSTAYLYPGISETCKWMYTYNQGCICWNVVWNENNGQSPRAALPAACSSCDMQDRNPPPSGGGSSYLGVSPVINGQPDTCSQCFEPISVATIPSNCASTSTPVIQQCFVLNGCSGNGCFRNAWGGTAMCHSCNAGYYSSPPSFTSCKACPAGSYSNTVGRLDAEEVISPSYSYYSTNPAANCQTPTLDSNAAWCSGSSNSGWIQIDLGRTRIVKGFVTQGNPTRAEWVTGYTITYSLDNSAWSTFANNAYEGNSDSHTRKVNFVYIGGAFSSISARYVRLSLTSLTSINNYFALRFNVLAMPVTSDVAVSNVSPCQPCPAGTFSVSTGADTPSACTMCSTGSYSASVGASLASVCTPCVAGKYSATSGAALSSTCSLCGTGTYSATSGMSSCTPCAAGSYYGSTGGASASVCVECSAGSYCPNPSTKTPCTSGNYCPLGTTSQALCPAGSVCLNPSTKTVCTSGNYCPIGSTTQAVCSAGSYCSTTIITALCPQNSYCPPGVTVPTLCPAGSIGAAAGTSTASNCGVCLPGTYSTTAGASACNICTGSVYCLGGTNVPVPCSSNPVCVAPQFIQSCTTTSNAQCANCNNNLLPSNSHWMDNVVDNCVWACDRSPAYYFKTGTTCQACKIPSDCASGNYVTTCTATADGVCTLCNNKPALNSYYTSNSPQYDASSCDWSCNAGYKKEGNACVSCSPTGYTPFSGATACTPCPVCTATGDYRKDCTGTSQGTCEKCTSTT